MNYFSSAYTAAVSAVDPDAGHGELVIKVPSELWKQGDGKCLFFCGCVITPDLQSKNGVPGPMFPSLSNT